MMKAIKKIFGYAIDDGEPKWVRDDTPNSSNKTYTVPAGKRWEMLGIYAQLQTSADAGNRYLRIDLNDKNGNNKAQPFYVAATAASQYGAIRQYFNAAMPASTTVFTRFDSASATVNVALTIGVGRTVLSAGDVIKVWDSAAIAAAADDMIVVLHYIETDDGI